VNVPGLRRLVVVAAISLAIASLGSCASGEGTGLDSTTSSTSPPPSLQPMQMTVIQVAGLDRPEPPPAADPSATTVATVPVDPAQTWSADAWGPDTADPVPVVPEGFTPVVLWDQVPTAGRSLRFQSARMDGDTLVIEADRMEPGAGCVTAQVVVGTTYLLGVRVDGVTPATPVRLETRPVPVDCPS
jgi:hypothetical protein